MKASAVALAIATLGPWGLSAGVHGAVVNGGFETGNLSGWSAAQTGFNAEVGPGVFGFGPYPEGRYGLELRYHSDPPSAAQLEAFWIFPMGLSMRRATAM